MNEETIWDLGTEALVRTIARSGGPSSPIRVEKPPLTCYNGAEDGIRTRDPHLGKVFEFVHGVQRESSELVFRPRNVHRIRPNSTLL